MNGNADTTEMQQQPHVTIHGDYWAKIPEALIYSDTSGNAIKIYGALMRHGSDPSNCYPSHARLAELCHMGEKTVRRALSELVDGGWVEVEHRYDADGRQTSNGYHIHLDPSLSGGVVTGDQGEVDTRDQGRWTPVTDEREQLNESQLNEKASSAKSVKNPRARAAEVVDDDAEAHLTTALNCLGLAHVPTPTIQELKTWQRALTRGWQLIDLIDKTAEAVAVADNPRAYLLACIRDMAARNPRQDGMQPIHGMSPPVDWTPERLAEADTEYWDRVS